MVFSVYGEFNQDGIGHLYYIEDQFKNAIHFHVTDGSGIMEYRVFPSGKPLKGSKPLPPKAAAIFKKNKALFSRIEKKIGKWYKGAKC